MTLLAVKEGRAYNTNESTRKSRPREAVAFCPGCKALQTVWLNGNTLMPTRKFSQEGREVYHDCGSSQPCRLYQGW